MEYYYLLPSEKLKKQNMDVNCQKQKKIKGKKIYIHSAEI